MYRRPYNRDYRENLKNVAEDTPIEARWILSDGCGTGLDQNADHGRFETYMASKLPNEEDQRLAGQGLLMPLRVRLNAVRRSNKEQALLDLLNAEARGANVTDLIKLHKLVFPRQPYENLKTRCSTPSGLHDMLHALMKIDKKDDARRHLTLERLAEIYAPIVSWVDDHCDEDTKASFRTVTSATWVVGLQFLTDSCCALFRGLGYDYPFHNRLSQFGCFPKILEIMYVNGQKVSLTQLKERIMESESQLSQNERIWLRCTSPVDRLHLGRLYWYWLDLEATMEFSVPWQRRHHGYLRTVVSRVRNYLTHEENAVFHDHNQEAVQFINLLVPLMFCLIYNSRITLAETRSLVLPHMPTSEQRNFYLDRRIISYDYPRY